MVSKTNTKKTAANKPGTVRSTGGSKRGSVQQTLEQYEANRMDKQVASWLLHSTSGRLVLVLTAFFALIGINLIIAQGNFDRFALATGVEVIAAGLINWLIYAIRTRGTT